MNAQQIQAEREAFEQQRLDLIEQRRQEILRKGKTLGYRVKETKENGQIRMVLVTDCLRLDYVPYTISRPSS